METGPVDSTISTLLVVTGDVVSRTAICSSSTIGSTSL
nr:MAG TPA: hypothetical protein [Caudoviricetes sp.]